ncbi:MAG: hypothetical protein CVT64_11070 [Actinobacteria bacterium HGW-Actinobacteria-4]|nr:MAG: hypothetical protein CVT64_11070 [Actinobacteria bacterium HGW-Actinobacteria-4]
MRFMGKGKREKDAGPQAVTAFWAWWASEGRNIDPHQASRAADELTRKVGAINADLTWNFGPGEASEHRLTVSAGGVAAVRPAAERWLRAAPEPDKTWEYRASQEADPDAMSRRLQIAGQELDLSLTTFRVEPVEEELRVHVGVYHPAFARLPQGVPVQITYLVLDWVLGEDDVERWLGHIETLDVAPANGTSVDALRGAVASIAQARDPDAWTLAEWSDKKGLPGHALFRRGLRWLDHPTFDRHHLLTRPFAAQDNGLPLDAATVAEIQELDVELEAALGHGGVFVGRETYAGTSTFHVYSDGEDQNVDARLREFASSHGMSSKARLDPAWSEVRHFTG